MVSTMRVYPFVCLSADAPAVGGAAPGGGEATRDDSIGHLAKSASVYKAERFSDHAPLTIDYDFSV